MKETIEIGDSDGASSQQKKVMAKKRKPFDDLMDGVQSMQEQRECR